MESDGTMMYAPLTVGVAQIAPVWLDRAGTLAKMVDDAAAKGRGPDVTRLAVDRTATFVD